MIESGPVEERQLFGINARPHRADGEVGNAHSCDHASLVRRIELSVEIDDKIVLPEDRWIAQVDMIRRAMQQASAEGTG